MSSRIRSFGAVLVDVALIMVAIALALAADLEHAIEQAGRRWRRRFREVRRRT